MPNSWLNVPLFQQEVEFSCVAACVRMVLAHFGDIRPEAERTSHSALVALFPPYPLLYSLFSVPLCLCVSVVRFFPWLSAPLSSVRTTPRTWEGIHAA